MGTSCSKICKKKTKRYEKKDVKKHKRDQGDKNHHNKRNGHRNPKQQAEGGAEKRKGPEKPCQPVEEESSINYATNESGTKENNKGNDENMKENNYIRPNINDKEKVDDNRDKKDYKKARGKRRKQKHKRKSYSSDSSWSSSSSSSSSSSEEDNGKTTKTRQKKRNNDGSVTYIKNKTTIGSSKISFKAAKNINIYKNNYMTQPKPEKLRKLFIYEYTEKTAKVEERNLFSLFRGQKPTQGQFVDLRGQENVQSVFTSSVLCDCSKWIGQIVFPRGSCTCFRVGTNYIMTALHSVKKIIDNSVEYLPVQEDSSQNGDGHLCHLSDHNIFVDFNFLTENQPRPERNKFHFKHIRRVEDIPFEDEETDTIVLELENEPNKRLPMQFTNFGIPVLDKTFHLITHSNGRPKEFDKVYKMVDINAPQTFDDINFLNQESRRFLAEKGKCADRHPCEIRPYDILANHNRMLFHCASNKGASGSPGVQVTSSGRVVVVTMLLHGYPDWYYDRECEDIKAGWPEQYTIEQGVNFASVYVKMRNKNASLCADVFPVANQPTDSTFHTVSAVPPTDEN
ncbi:uncharacterized protein LOC123557284 [Mercenaria mercenaria]|uniref:uncharacterized protein LOC123557284 n=1 Tax=Mercenaria mercenaria TaxID=6596 RepID=UPI00234EE623|nr:uncharacterized protein LOC123557284 [Mercenaria mercenaria]XP_053381501.1 uncharacterized protein LOC123557284 [Mercenaria mercenaria]XP_053381503.1 uncharacterized protein LOC123557284 [Mercenaria mercenaria]